MAGTLIASQVASDSTSVNLNLTPYTGGSIYANSSINITGNVAANAIVTSNVTANTVSSNTITANTITFGDGSTIVSHAVPQVTVLTSGSGTYTTPTNCKFLFVKMVGGGGSGGAYTADGVAGGTTTFGSSFLTCTGGNRSEEHTSELQSH